MPESLDEMRLRLKGLRGRFLAGAPVEDEMHALADECAALYNQKAKEVAERMGVRPRLITRDRIMRSEIRAR